jgi:hypothetical protein
MARHISGFEDYDERGWRKPRAGTQARMVYDLYRTGLDSTQIAERIGRRRNYVSVVISQFGWRDLVPSKADCSKNQDAGVRGSADWKQRISAGVRKAYAEGRVVKGARYDGLTFKKAEAIARQVEDHWRGLGYYGVVCEVVDSGEVHGHRVYDVKSNLVNGVPPRQLQLVAAE